MMNNIPDCLVYEPVKREIPNETRAKHFVGLYNRGKYIIFYI